MKKRVIAMFAIVAVFGLAIAAYAYTKTTNSTIKASCCAKSDSCPMKGKKDHEKSGDHAGKSCPMKEHGADAKTEGHNRCGCCGDSCPMKKEGETKATAASASEAGKDCCDNCDCCKGKNSTV